MNTRKMIANGCVTCAVDGLHCAKSFIQEMLLLSPEPVMHEQPAFTLPFRSSEYDEGLVSYE
jgi:hypothetical protein